MIENYPIASSADNHYLLVPPEIVLTPQSLSIEVQCACGCLFTGSSTGLQETATALLSKIVAHFKEEQGQFSAKEFAVDLWKYLEMVKKQLEVQNEISARKSWEIPTQPAFPHLMAVEQ